jgi:spermidine synthase
MNRWEELEVTEIPNGGGALRLMRRVDEFSIRIIGRGELMNSRTHGSEDALGRLACEPYAKHAAARVLIGGLGMGFTLATALQSLGASAKVEVAELVPGVVAWNQRYIGHCAGQPLQDARVKVEVADVRDLIENANGSYHAILLDVDNGPEGLTHDANDALYTLAGLAHAYHALTPDGTLAVWSAAPAPRFVGALRKAGFTVEQHKVRAHAGKGPRHLIWLATRDTKH